MNLANAKWLETFRAIFTASGWETGALAVASLVFWMLVRTGGVSTSDLWDAIPVLLALILGSLTLVRIIKAKFERRREARAARNYIPNMTDREKAIIGYLLYHNRKTFLMPAHLIIAAPLISRGIIRENQLPKQTTEDRLMLLSVPDNIGAVLERNRGSFPYTPPEGEKETPPWFR